MSKVAEKLTILLETGQGFLVRLYNTRVKYSPENSSRPSFLGDPAFAKVIANFVKRFPEIPSDLDKVGLPFLFDPITLFIHVATRVPPSGRVATYKLHKLHNNHI